LREQIFRFDGLSNSLSVIIIHDQKILPVISITPEKKSEYARSELTQSLLLWMCQWCVRDERAGISSYRHAQIAVLSAVGGMIRLD
jgi:hypothetical protein